MNKVKSQPELRFPEFKGDWKDKKIKDVLSIGSGKDYKHLEKGTIPVYGTGGFMTSVDDYLYEGDSVCIGRKGTINKPLLLKGKFWTVDTLFFTHSFDGILPRFAFLLFQKIDWLKYNEASGVPSLSKTTIEEINIKIPPFHEQDKIASFFVSVDERIDRLIQKKEKLELYKKRVMQQIFNQEIRFKTDRGTDFPEWKEWMLSEIGDTYNGLTGKSKVDFGFGKPYIQYMQIFSNSKIDIRQFGLVDISENDNQNKAQKGDVFFTTSSETPNEIGTASVLLEDVEEVYLNSFCFGFRPNSILELIPEFAQFLFRSGQVRRKIIRLAQGSTRYNMSKVEFMKQTIMLPTPEEQLKIASFLSAIDNKIENANSQVDYIKKWKKGLLQQMFV